jgi:hypothetical protein
VCPYCRSVVGRGDKGLEDLGKVADLVETASPLDVGIKGRFNGIPFELTGRTQFKHPAGGVWDEWYAAFTDGTWGWLAEAQGRFYLTFEKPVPAGLPDYPELRLGQKVAVADGVELIVAEKNTGQTASAIGEIPYRVVPGEAVPFADLSGPRGEFGTLDYSGDQQALYVGRQVTLDELGIPPKARRKYPGQEPTIQAVQLNCPQCGGQLALRAPDKTERVGCPTCGALLDVKEGQLKLLKSLKPPEVQPVLPLGGAGVRDGIEWTVIGFMQRYVTFEGTDYFWEEYLLYQPRLGFRWLTRSDEHWNWVEALPPGAVSVDGNVAVYAGRWHRLFQKATARVSFVVGEFYWKVTAGEKVFSRDYVHAPYMLSEEVTKDGDEGEVNWSHAVYLRPEEVERMFGLKTALPRPTTIGPNQPFPHTGVYKMALWLLAAAVIVAGFFLITSPRRRVFQETYQLEALKDNQRSKRIFVAQPLALRARRNIRVTVVPRGSTPWAYIDGYLTPAEPAPKPGQETLRRYQERREFAFLASGGPARVYLSALPAGQYNLQFDLAWQDPKQPASVEVRIDQGVPHAMPIVLMLFLLGAVPLAVALYQIWFESARWADSNIS